MRRLVYLAEAPPLETPLLLLAQLREIDPTVELINFGIARPITTGKHSLVGRTDLQDWRLGAVRPSDIREHAGRTILELESRRSIKNMANVLLGQLLLQGFAQISRYLSEGTPGQAPTWDDEGFIVNIVEDFRERDHEFNKADQGESKFLIRLDDTEMGPEKRENVRILRDKLHTDGRAEFRRARRGAIITNIWGG